ncbi:PIN domain-containing protein [Aphanizomenon sp. CS-733/32]|uniref:PIN domain-containing protein n=1 Tax=Aphanizomenon sp. CS-733/32 TaxID=3021715 RepID=UPI00232B6EED|nr:PIN domain-containing protein [Aphanizomenon sp. CS-733/32]MDB9309833.1 PIN domain-containing protein [Aphanizomenon sp. CS-733/32]
MTILYIETNFFMSIAKGQDSQAENLLYNPPNSVKIFIPNICYIEAVSVYKLEKQEKLKFKRELELKITEIDRDKTSNYAPLLSQQLQETIITNNDLLNDIEDRLTNAINTQITSINLEFKKLQDICKSMLIQPETLLIKNDIMDNVILQCILDHAQSHPQEDKAFISNNSKDFGKPEVKEVLRNAGIKYFTITQDFLNWFNSRSST